MNVSFSIHISTETINNSNDINTQTSHLALSFMFHSNYNYNYNCNGTKFFVPILTLLTTNKYTAKKSTQFTEEILNTKFSYEVEINTSYNIHTNISAWSWCRVMGSKLLHFWLLLSKDLKIIRLNRSQLTMPFGEWLTVIIELWVSNDRWDLFLSYHVFFQITKTWVGICQEVVVLNIEYYMAEKHKRKKRIMSTN